MRLMLKIGLSGLVIFAGWSIFNNVVLWLLNMANDLAIAAGFVVALLTSAGCVTVFQLLWSKEFKTCVNYLGL